MDQAVALDTLRRRSGSRRYPNIEEKRQIVEESLVPGTSVAMIARKYEVNANQVFSWRRLYQQGLLEVRDAGVALAKSELALAIRYALARYRDDGQLEIVNNTAERALRAVALGRKN